MYLFFFKTSDNLNVSSKSFINCQCLNRSSGRGVKRKCTLGHFRYSVLTVWMFWWDTELKSYLVAVWTNQRRTFRFVKEIIIINTHCPYHKNINHVRNDRVAFSHQQCSPTIWTNKKPNLKYRNVHSPSKKTFYHILNIDFHKSIFLTCLKLYLQSHGGWEKRWSLI